MHERTPYLTLGHYSLFHLNSCTAVVKIWTGTAASLEACCHDLRHVFMKPTAHSRAEQVHLKHVSLSGQLSTFNI